MERDLLAMEAKILAQKVMTQMNSINSLALAASLIMNINSEMTPKEVVARMLKIRGLNGFSFGPKPIKRKLFLTVWYIFNWTKDENCDQLQSTAL